ncbi:hypothetical protein F5883DRAFT_88289 [Diaporthe sp. PMI_573]|jgi:hypothetical protein|nr:hypothetical protein F5883DRAFT_88289 [Diaporthaceae sp. PMI_573]
MAEAVGLAASIAALASLAHTSLKFFKETKSIMRDMRYLDEETKRSMRRISFAAGCIKRSQRTLSAYCTAGGTDSSREAIQFIEEHEAATFLETESECISLLIDKLRTRVYDLHKQWVFMATMLWRYFIKDQIEDLREDMEFIQVGLGLLLTSVLLDVALKRERRDGALMQVTLLPDTW